MEAHVFVPAAGHDPGLVVHLHMDGADIEMCIRDRRRTVRRQGGGIEGVEAAGKGVDQGDTLVGVGGVGEHIGVGDVDVGGVPVAPGGEVQCDGAAGGEPGVLQGGQGKDRSGVGLEDAPPGVAASAGGAAPQPGQQQGDVYKRQL